MTPQASAFLRLCLHTLVHPQFGPYLARMPIVSASDGGTTRLDMQARLLARGVRVSLDDLSLWLAEIQAHGAASLARGGGWRINIEAAKRLSLLSTPESRLS